MSVARELRPVGLISSGGRGPGGAEMTTDDKVNLFLGVCGVETAKLAAEYVRIWRSAIPERMKDEMSLPLAFVRATNIKELLVEFITKDLNAGGLDAWSNQEADTLKKVTGSDRKREVTLDFLIDEFDLTLMVSWSQVSTSIKKNMITIRRRFVAPLPPFASRPPRLDASFAAPSHLIRRLDEKNLIGWGQCLVSAPIDRTIAC